MAATSEAFLIVL